MRSLSDGQKRAAYDQHGHAAFESGGMGGGSPFGAGAQGFDFSDIFGDIFGGGRGGAGRSNVQRGADLRYNLEVTLEQAARGTETQDPHPDHGGMRNLPRYRRQTGNHPGHLHDLRAGMARCACSRASSRSSKPARAATAPAR